MIYRRISGIAALLCCSSVGSASASAPARRRLATAQPVRLHGRHRGRHCSAAPTCYRRDHRQPAGHAVRDRRRRRSALDDRSTPRGAVSVSATDRPGRRATTTLSTATGQRLDRRHRRDRHQHGRRARPRVLTRCCLTILKVTTPSTATVNYACVNNTLQPTFSSTLNAISINGNSIPLTGITADALAPRPAGTAWSRSRSTSTARRRPRTPRRCCSIQVLDSGLLAPLGGGLNLNVGTATASTTQSSPCAGTTIA